MDRVPKWRRILAFSCLHCPEHDPRAVDWLCDQISTHQPDELVNLGDTLESNASSRWDDAFEKGIPLQREFETADKVLGQIRAAAPNGCTFKFMPGNHEDNIQSPGRLDIRVRGLLRWERAHEVKEGVMVNTELSRQWETVADYIYDRQRGTYRVGQATFFHGWEAGGNSDEFQAFRLGVYNGLCVSGHTHRPVDVTQARRTSRISLPWWYANVGCLRDLKPQYMKRKDTTRWGHACLVADIDPKARVGTAIRWQAQLLRRQA